MNFIAICYLEILKTNYFINGEIAYMNIENYIDSKYIELQKIDSNNEFDNLYDEVENEKFRFVLSTLHYNLISLFRIMNTKLPTTDCDVHFCASSSRELIYIIDMITNLYDAVNNTRYAFEIDSYYDDIIGRCRGFLRPSGGSTLPKNMEKIELYYVKPIFKIYASISVNSLNGNISYKLKQIGEGSYANVYKYKDTFYNRYFAVKRAKKDLSEKELERFKREFDEMSMLSSPYILDVYCYNNVKNEYIMEYMDYTLHSYIEKFNQVIPIKDRKNIILQIFKAFDYIHVNNRLHRDISPKNILIKKYDDIPVIKISDFGLVKIPESNLTTMNTEFKGCFNDPSLVYEGFNAYDISHETYALTRIVYYVMTGKTNTNEIENEEFLQFIKRGLNIEKTKRFHNVAEMLEEFRKIKLFY